MRSREHVFYLMELKSEIFQEMGVPVDVIPRNQGQRQEWEKQAFQAAPWYLRKALVNASRAENHRRRYRCLAIIFKRYALNQRCALYAAINRAFPGANAAAIVEAWDMLQQRGRNHV